MKGKIRYENEAITEGRGKQANKEKDEYGDRWVNYYWNEGGGGKTLNEYVDEWTVDDRTKRMGCLLHFWFIHSFSILDSRWHRLFLNIRWWGDFFFLVIYVTISHNEQHSSSVRWHQPSHASAFIHPLNEETVSRTFLDLGGIWHRATHIFNAKLPHPQRACSNYFIRFRHQVTPWNLISRFDQIN